METQLEKKNEKKYEEKKIARTDIMSHFTECARLVCHWYSTRWIYEFNEITMSERKKNKVTLITSQAEEPNHQPYRSIDFAVFRPQIFWKMLLSFIASMAFQWIHKNSLKETIKEKNISIEVHRITFMELFVMKWMFSCDWWCSRFRYFTFL